MLVFSGTSTSVIQNGKHCNSKLIYCSTYSLLIGVFQLVSSLSKEAVHVSIDLIRVPNVGWCLRFSPLTTAASKYCTQAHNYQTFITHCCVC